MPTTTAQVPVFADPNQPLSVIMNSLEGDRSAGKLFLDYGGDETKYDSAIKVTVSYRYNNHPEEKDCLENRMLAMEEDHEFYAAGVDASIREYLYKIPFFFKSITCITIKTVEGQVTLTTSEDEEEIIPYPPVPPLPQGLPRTLLEQLAKITDYDERIISMTVDRVVWNGESYAFKRADEDVDAAVEELTALLRLRDSPAIVHVEAVVVDKENLFRGFLTPYLSSGNLETAISKSKEALAWTSKLAWAKQIVQGVVDMHALKIYHGDLKPQNILIDNEGRAQLIDFAPIGFSGGWASPEVIAADKEDPDFNYLEYLNALRTYIAWENFSGLYQRRISVPNQLGRGRTRQGGIEKW
jgi:serine/threonine protein kinase